jgi:hypothetical protein
VADAERFDGLVGIDQLLSFSMLIVESILTGCVYTIRYRHGDANVHTRESGAEGVVAAETHLSHVDGERGG